MFVQILSQWLFHVFFRLVGFYNQIFVGPRPAGLPPSDGHRS